MAKFVGKNEAEKIVLNYILKNTPREYSKFNPIKLESKEIAKNTNLDEKDVNEALEKLSEGSPRIEQIRTGFQFWLPLDENGEEIKSEVYKKSLAYFDLFLPIFVLIILSFYFLQLLVQKGFLSFDFSDYFYWGAILTGLYIWFIKKISGKFYYYSQKIRNIKYYKFYVWSFIIFTGIIVYMFNKGLHTTGLVKEIIFYISILASLITIIAFVINLLRKKEVRSKRK